MPGSWFRVQGLIQYHSSSYISTSKAYQYCYYLCIVTFVTVPTIQTLLLYTHNGNNTMNGNIAVTDIVIVAMLLLSKLLLRLFDLYCSITSVVSTIIIAMIMIMNNMKDITPIFAT